MTIGSSEGLSIGSEMSAGVRNVTFQDITVHAGPKNTSFMARNQRGVNIKSQRGRGGIVEDITYSNIMLHGVVYAIDITLNYTYPHDPTNATATPQFRNIKIDNLVSYGATYGWRIDGLPESYISNVSLSNINLVGTTTLFRKCDFIRGSCSNLTVFPFCPPCMQ
jgi:polygalacturonase